MMEVIEMKFMNLNKNFYNDEEGSVAVITAIVLFFVLIGIAALAIDIGRLAATKNELQNVSDAAALAGAGELGNIYITQHNQGQSTFTCNAVCKESIYEAVRDVAILNQAAGVNINIPVPNNILNDIKIGIWQNASFDSTETNQPNAVKVTARRDDNVNNPISNFFAGILGFNTSNVRADATAALTGPSIVGPGELNTPFGLSERAFPDMCGDVVRFSPTTEACAGWHNFFDAINANQMERKFLGFIQGHTGEYYNEDETLLSIGSQWLDTNFNLNQLPTAQETPETAAGDEFEFQGGTISSLFLGAYLDRNDYDGNTGTVHGNDRHPAPFFALYDYFRFRDNDNNDEIWTAKVPVYKDFEDRCRNPNTDIEILGFAQIEVRMPNPPPDSTVDVLVDCNMTPLLARGGGGEFGNILSVIPNLVE